MDHSILEKAAALARLGSDSDPEWAAGLAQDLAGLLGAVNILNEADLSGVEPLYSPLQEVAGPRPDEPGSGADPEDLLNQAPDRVGRFFAVPKII